MPVRQINMEALESRFVISDSDFSINPFGPVQWAHKIILHDWLVKHGNMCAHTERGVRYLHRKSSIHLSLKEASTQLASQADVLRGAWQAKRTSAWEATKRRTTPWTPAVILVSAVLQVDNSLRLQTLSTGPTSCPWWGVRAQHCTEWRFYGEGIVHPIIPTAVKFRPLLKLYLYSVQTHHFLTWQGY